MALVHMRTSGTEKSRQVIACIVVCEGGHFVEEKNESSCRHVEAWVVLLYLRHNDL